MKVLPEIAQALDVAWISPEPESLPAPMVSIHDFREQLAGALEESRSTLDPFIVMLLSVDDFSEGEHGMAPERHETQLRQLGLHVMACLRSKHSPAYPRRKLDVVSRLGHYFAAICFNTGSDYALCPIQRVVSKLETIMPSLTGDNHVRVRVAFWSWSWKTCAQSELSVLRQLKNSLQEGDDRIRPLPLPNTPLERKVAEALGRLSS